MPRIHDILNENRRTLILAFPIIAGQLGQMLMGWADTIMIGHVGVSPLAACAFALTVTQVFLVFGFGIISSVSIRASQAFGAKRYRETGETLISGTVLGVVTGLGVTVFILALIPLYGHLGQPPEIVRESRTFLVLITLSTIPALVLGAGKAYSEALSRPWLPFWILMGGVGLNIVINWPLIYGKLGFPALGLTGAGIGTLVARIVTVVVLYAFIFFGKNYRPFLAPRMPGKVLAAQLGELLKLGLPSGFHLLGEVGLFATASLLIGTLGVTALAAHQVAITCAATTFMVPLGLSFAVTVQVGQAVGAREYLRIRHIVAGALALTLAVMGCFALMFFTEGRWIVSLFVTNPGVDSLAASLLIVAGVFQIFDGLQIVGMGALRGLADVRIPLLLVYLCHWTVAFPVCCLLGFAFHLGVVGIWSGLATGLAFIAACVLVRLWHMTKPERWAGLAQA